MNFAEALERDDGATVSRIVDEEIGAFAQNEVRHASRLQDLKRLLHLIGVSWQHEEIGRTADLEGRMLAHRLVREDIALSHHRLELFCQLLCIAVLSHMVSLPLRRKPDASPVYHSRV